MENRSKSNCLSRHGTLPRSSPLRSLRLERGLTQERLGVLAGLSRCWAGYLERNPEAMTPGAAERLAAVLGVAPAVLLATEVKA